ncbi:hypothetical protein CWI36_0518p0030 [Hamiltosporidium magnivora]|uniref:Uncharacterized protein n=1 Tax=Hamiltosporidium magnivora TaxID=148818 RepID=A0A4Q9LDS7_9MICR|nr:hypothetical protein CWI36_0518p0030 [Hamiltosporidium magnivora]
MTLTKDTRFKDLSEDIKLRLSSIYQHSRTRPVFRPIPDVLEASSDLMISISSLPTKQLTENYMKLSVAANRLKDDENNTFCPKFLKNNLKKQIDCLQRDIFMFTEFMHEKNFISFLQDIYMRIAGKYICTRNMFIKKNFLK